MAEKLILITIIIHTFLLFTDISLSGIISEDEEEEDKTLIFFRIGSSLSELADDDDNIALRFLPT